MTPELDEGLERLLEHVSDPDRRLLCRVESTIVDIVAQPVGPARGPHYRRFDKLVRGIHSRALRYWCEDALEEALR